MAKPSSVITGIFATLVALPSWAEVPDVVTDILPVHGLVSQVMAGVGEPDVLLKPGASPHGYAMRPSDAAALQNAEVVFWIGEALAPWLADSLETLAGDARTVALLEADGTIAHEYRGDGHAGHDHGEKDHDDHGDEHSVDPHAWLDVENARTWLGVITAELALADPDNAARYAANAKAALGAIDAAESVVAERMANVGSFALYHDSLQYFEKRYGLAATFVVEPDDLHSPGPARIGKIRTIQRENPVLCIFVEPFNNTKLTQTIFDDQPIKVIEVDALGAHIPPGESYFPELLRDIGAKVGSCR